MRRRDFITGIAGSMAAWPLVARAQHSAMPVVGFLHPGSLNTTAEGAHALRQALSEAGHIEGQNVAIEYRWAEGHYDRLPELAVDLVRRQVAVIVAGTIQAALAVKDATVMIPIVFAIGSDPVKFGLVASFNRPGGNITGVTWLGGDTLAAKRLQLIQEVIPQGSVIAALVNPNNPAAETESRELEEAARTLGLQLHIVKAGSERELAPVFAAVVQLRASALVVSSDVLFFSRRNQLLTARHALPAIYQWHEFAAAGGLMSYGASHLDAWRQAGKYTARILKGEKPAELPIQQAVKVELAINLKTAKTLGLTFPITLLGRADEVIE